MTRLAGIFVLLFILAQPLLAQDLGTPSAVTLSGTSTTLTLDFSDRDYELILYSLKTNETDTARTFNFSLTGAFAATKPIALPSVKPAPTTDRDRLEFELRQHEKNLAHRLQQTGGHRPSAQKTVLQQIGTTRSFAFDAFGKVTTDRTLTATLVATSDRAIAYVDVAMPDTINLTTAQIQTQIDRFSSSTYPTVTSVFGNGSDVDNDGKVIFLYTSLVAEVGGVAGFYSASSVLPQNQGGNGNVADLMYINPTTEADVYESLLAHEFQHLVSFNQHVLVRNGEGEDSWLNEGMSHVCEDLVDQHVQGGNRDLIERLLDAPNNYSLTAQASFSTGVRGAAYMFARSLIEEYGSDVPSRLVQTDKIGIANVENMAGQPFATIFDKHLARLFLSGSGLNSTHNYTPTFLSETTTGGRSIPPPREFAISPEGLSVSGNIKPLSAAYLRLMGNQNQGTITIQTDADGDFRAQLIPIPRNYQPRMALPVDYFPALTFDAPLVGPFSPGQSIRVSGSTTDTALEGFKLAFEPVEGVGDTIEFSSVIRNGRFDRSIVFHPSHAGDYKLVLFLNRGSDSLPFGGRFTPFSITNETATVNLPTDFFPDITLDTAIPTAITSGQAVRLSGTVQDPTATQLLFRLDPIGGGDTITFSTDITSNRFADYLLFLPSQVGDYVFNIFMGSSSESLPHLEKFFPLTVTQGSGDFTLPTDFFTSITFDTTFPGVISTGDNVRIAGTVSDPSTSEILFRFNALDGSDTLRFSASVTGGQFTSSFIFLPDQVGNYELDIFMGQSNQSLSFIDRFQPITVKQGESAATIPTDFFPGITFTSPLAVDYTAGQGFSIGGTSSDPTVTQILFRFDPATGGDPIRCFTDVSNGQFGRGFVFQPTEGGTYDLVIFAGQAGQSLAHIGTFSSITVTATGNERVVLPVDFFTGLIFDSPVGATIFAGQEVRLIGQTKDASITQLAIRFDNNATGESLPTTFASVTNGRFDQPISFEASQTGTYTIIFFGGQAGQSLSSLDSYSPITVQASQPALELAQSTLSWGELSAGNTQNLAAVIRNIGSAILTLSNITTEAPFAVASSALTIAAGDSATVNVTFAPTAAGTFTSTLQMATNDPSNASILIALSGSAIVTTQPELQVRQTSLDWGELTVGQSGTRTITLVNPGTDELILTLASDNTLFALSNDALTIAPGDSATVIITLAPTTAGSIAGNITIASNATTNGQAQVTLSGSAVDAVQPPDTPTTVAYTVSTDLDAAEGNQNTATQQIGTDEVVSIQIWADGISGALGFEASFAFDPAQVAFDGFTVGPGLPGGVSPGPTLSDTTVSVSAAILGGTSTVDAGLLGTATFRTTANLTETTIRLKSIRLSRNDFFETLAPNTALTLTVQSGAPTPDFDGDGQVGFTDFLLFAGSFGSSSGQAAYNAKLDLNSDGQIGFPDFLVFASSFGKPVSG